VNIILSRYLNKTESVGVSKADCWHQIANLTVSATKC